MQMMADMHPKFLRMPGGNFLEGNNLADAYDWKKTIGPIVDRAGHNGSWFYSSSDGVGLLDYLTWCDDLHIEPVLAVNAGYALDHTHVNPGPDLAPLVQSALDEVEYVTGDTSTHWGAVRAKNGHPTPFVLHYIEASSTGTVHLRLVNAHSTPETLTIVGLPGSHTAEISSLHASTWDDTNSITDPTHIRPFVSTVPVKVGEWSHTIPANTIEVIDIPSR